ncbi:hypothetical protein ACLB1E_05750 [Escherichia coli]
MAQEQRVMFVKSSARASMRLSYTASAQYGSAAPADHARCHVQWRHPDLSRRDSFATSISSTVSWVVNALADATPFPYPRLSSAPAHRIRAPEKNPETLQIASEPR